MRGGHADYGHADYQASPPSTRAVFATLCALAATACLFAAVVFPAEWFDWVADNLLTWLPDEIRPIGDVAIEGSDWIRGALVAVGAGFMLLPRTWQRLVWPEVSVALILAIGGWAAVQAAQPDSDSTTGDGDEAEPATFDVTTPEITTVDAPISGEVILLVVHSEVEDGRVVYESSRYEATVDGTSVSIERGTDDETAKTFAADLAGARRIYALPRPAEEPEK